MSASSPKYDPVYHRGKEPADHEHRYEPIDWRLECCTICGWGRFRREWIDRLQSLFPRQAIAGDFGILESSGDP